MSYQVRPFGRPLIQCFFGGEFAASLEREGEAAMAAFAAGELANLFGNDIRGRLRLLAASQWRQEPFARGSYSYARPGHADDRHDLDDDYDHHHDRGAAGLGTPEFRKPKAPHPSRERGFFF